MASTSRGNHRRAVTYDVFLSFRGEDTRYTFTDHLYEALIRAGLGTFRDDDAIPRGEVLKPEIEAAIIESRASIVVLSENYANSRWCLDELCLILDQKRKCDHFVVPIFYHVEPSDVRKQTKRFAIQESKGTVDDDVTRWKAALTEVSYLKGDVVSGSRYETYYITRTVDAVRRKLDLKQLSTPSHLIGMETRVGVINSWLKNEQSDAIAICGMGGSGKTTLAQYIYNLCSQDFERSSFVEEVGKHYKQGLFELQKQLLSDVSGESGILVSSVSEGTHKIEEVLHNKRVLIVLDDIDDPDELSILLGTNASPTQSKIIITTRLRDIATWFVSNSLRCKVHELTFMNDLESLEILSWHAFGSKTPMKGFEKLALQLAQYCGGNPLALKVLGSSLFVSDEDPQQRNDMIEIWRERMTSMKSMKGDLDCKILDVLRKSFDSLQLESHKELFLDIACFFVGESKDIVTILGDDLYVNYGITTLINRCLITFSPNGELMMHQLLQDMGRKIVCEESKHSIKCSRVWNDDDSYQMLRKGDASDTVEGLALDMRNVKQGMGSKALSVKTSSLSKMDKLKLLQIKYVKLSGSYKNFPDLKWLGWHGCPLKAMHPGLLRSSLVAIDMSYGHMEAFEPPTTFEYRGCYLLFEIQGLYKLVSVAKLDEAHLGHMKWIKAYQDHKGYLVAGRTINYIRQPLKMLYEYGIMCTYLQGIKDQSMPTYEYTSSSSFLSFRVPFHHERNRIRGLSVSCLYGSVGGDESTWFLLAKIRNTTKGLTWIYNPVIHREPKVDKDVLWLSYWPIGNILDAGDEVSVDIIVDKEKVVSTCGVSLVYMDDEVEKEENSGNNTMKEEEVIGGDLSEFEVTTGGYYLCRRDLFKSMTSNWLKRLFGSNIHYTESLGWRKTCQSWMRSHKSFRTTEMVVKVRFNSVYDIDNIVEKVYRLKGLNFLFFYKETGKLIVVGDVDPVSVVKCLRKSYIAKLTRVGPY